MTLITRISRLFSADLHAVLDRVEEPGIVLKQAVRDMQAAVADQERRIHTLRLQAEQLARTRDDASARLEESENELNACLNAENDDLARSVIHRRLQLERRLTELDARAETLRRALDEHERLLERRRRELEALRSKAEVYEQEGPEPFDSHPSCAVTREEVEVALLREKQRRAAS